MKRFTAKQYRCFGFFGFFGFLGFLYFPAQNASQLFFFSFFSFFSYFFLGGLIADMPDERYIENNNKARAKTMWIPISALFIIGWSAGWPFWTKEFTVIVSALGWAATFIVYSALFFYYEKK